ncbi:hypothetical protein F9278_36155 [Streptomyces phaeolivaceus]|uniref:Uncharacterized protein n=1 Tax=Streptomyces phaeolivaceus TaxID=2653200 RepID=A0A5P8KBK5_9ACTN|nr:hypothetical protein [Streptomyces phaeolivaceus]QFR00714.1 hypothetical protein F9278_36155 [Streptomyces phaeolivaceus]
MAGDQVVYEPDQYLEVLGTERHEQLKTWLRANCIDPADVTVGAPISIERETYDVTAHDSAGPVMLDGGRAIRHTVLLRNAEGRKYVDEATGDAAQEERVVPLVVEPPPQWRTEKESSPCQSSP